VERRRWISNDHFLHALNFCMLLPGPEAQQLATYVGWLLHGTRGGIVAGTLFILPGFLFMLALSWLYAAHGEVFAVAAVFYGLRAAVIAVVAAALIRIGKTALKNGGMVAIAAAAFVAIFVFRVPFPCIVLGAGALGFLGGATWPSTFNTSSKHGKEGEGPGTLIREQPGLPQARPGLGSTSFVLCTWVLVWWMPLIAILLWRGLGDVLSQEALFFGKAAMVTFGGAYAVLAYINQAAVEYYKWLTRPQMIAGLGLAETTPGPLILVTEFVGFLGAYGHPAGLPPAVAGILGAVVTTWATFAPSFLWIFSFAPFIERLRGNTRLNAALSAITASVVGVILNLAVWFGRNTLFHPVQGPVVDETAFHPSLSTLDPFTLIVALASFLGIWRLRWGIIPVVGGSAILGLIYRMAARALGGVG